MSVHEYQSGRWSALVADGALALLHPDVPDDVARELWQLTSSGKRLGAWVEYLAGAGIAALPSFAMVEAHEQGLRVLVRGEVDVMVGEHVISGRGYATWREEVVAAADVTLRAGSGESGWLPVTGGIVRAAVVRTLGELGEQPAAQEEDDVELTVVQLPALAAAVEARGERASEPPTEMPAPEPPTETPTPEPPTETPAPEPPTAPPAGQADGVDLEATRAPEPEPSDGAADPSDAWSAPDPLPAPDRPWQPPQLIDSVPSAYQPPVAASEGVAADAPPGALPVGMPVDLPPPSGAETTHAGAPHSGAETTHAGAPHWGAPHAASTHDASTHDDGDHDGETILASDLPVTDVPVAHEAQIQPAPQVELVLSSGSRIEMDRPVLLGRAPEATRFAGLEAPRLVSVPNPEKDVSGTHVEVRPAGGHVVVTDMNSTNGTVVRVPGQPELRLQPGTGIPVAPGAVIELGAGVSVTVAHVEVAP